MQVSPATHTQPAASLPAMLARFFLSAEHAQDDLALGQTHLTTIRAQRAFRDAGVAQAWLMGRAPEMQRGKVPARVVGILPAGQVSSAVLLEHIESLERVLRAVCGTPVKVHCFFKRSAVPTSAIPVEIRAAGERPQLSVPADAPSVPAAIARLPSANDSRVEVAPHARPAPLRAAALHH